MNIDKETEEIRKKATDLLIYARRNNLSLDSNLQPHLGGISNAAANMSYAQLLSTTTPKGLKDTVVKISYHGEGFVKTDNPSGYCYQMGFWEVKITREGEKAAAHHTKTYGEAQGIIRGKFGEAADPPELTLVNVISQKASPHKTEGTYSGSVKLRADSANFIFDFCFVVAATEAEDTLSVAHKLTRGLTEEAFAQVIAYHYPGKSMTDVIRGALMKHLESTPADD